MIMLLYNIALELQLKCQHAFSLSHCYQRRITGFQTCRVWQHKLNYSCLIAYRVESTMPTHNYFYPKLIFVFNRHY
jgi:hypothetical protein